MTSKNETMPVSAGPAHYTVSYFDADGPQTCALRAGKPHTIGRSDSCEIVVKHSTVSRNHAILVGSGPPSIKDLGSRNGTRVASRLLPPNTFVPVDVGTLVQVGDVVLFVQRSLDESVDTSPPPEGTNEDLTAAKTPKHQNATDPPNDDLVVRSPRTRELLNTAKIVAGSDLSVLILGETGVGKERLAQAVHTASPRATRPLVSLNCAAFPETMVESELFGYERGAFTGADRTKRGLIAAAEGGTLFLDEVGELTLPIQAKLLRVLEARELLPLGALKVTPVNVRIIAATNLGLQNAVATGRFREDLYYRLNGVTLQVPPLRERREDILPLAMRFAALFAAQLRRPVPLFTDDASAALLEYRWPGNIRELKNVIERATLLAISGIIEADAVPRAMGVSDRFLESEPDLITKVSTVILPRDVPPPSSRENLGGEGPELTPGKRRVITPPEIVSALSRTDGDQAEAAKLLGVSRRTLINYLDRFELPRPRKRPG